jgi:hypothetical protein
MFKKLLLSLLASVIILQSSVTPIAAQTEQWYDSGILNWFTKVYNTETSQPQEIFGERYTAAQVQWVIYSLIVLPMNMMFDSSFTACWLERMDSGDNVWECLNNPAVGELLLRIVNFVRAVNPLIPNSSLVEPVADSSPSSNMKFLFEVASAERPVSGISYFRNLGRRATLVPEVQVMVMVHFLSFSLCGQGQGTSHTAY